MPLWEMSDQSFAPVPETSLVAAGLKEVEHLQRHLAENLAALDADLLLLDREFTGLASGKRVDLLAVDSRARLVVIELKRDDDAHMDLQALRYAAQVSHMTFAEAVHRLSDRGDPDAEASLLAHLGWTEPDETRFNPDVRIVLVAADFGSELTTAVLWLTTRHSLDIRCVRLQPHTLDGRTLLNIEQVLPLKEAAAYQTGLKKKQAAEDGADPRATLCRQWWDGVLAAAAAENPAHPFTGVNARGWEWIAIGKGLPGGLLAIAVGREHWHVELRLESGTAEENRRLFDRLREQREVIERSFGGTLSWMPTEGAKVCKVQHRRDDGGWVAPPEKHPELQRAQADAMLRFDRALRPALAEAAGSLTGP